jgi:hypothetical protein
LKSGLLSCGGHAPVARNRAAWGPRSDDRNVNIRYDDVSNHRHFLGVMVKLTFEGRLTLWQPSPINAAIVAYYSVCIFSTLLALERSLPAWDKRSAFFVMLKMLEFYLIFFMVAHSVRRSRELRFPIVLFFLVMLIVSSYRHLLHRHDAPGERTLRDGRHGAQYARRLPGDLHLCGAGLMHPGAADSTQSCCYAAIAVHGLHSAAVYALSARPMAR